MPDARAAPAAAVAVCWRVGSGDLRLCLCPLRPKVAQRVGEGCDVLMVGFSCFHAGRAAWETWLIRVGGGLIFAETQKSQAKSETNADKTVAVGA